MKGRLLFFKGGNVNMGHLPRVEHVADLLSEFESPIGIAAAAVANQRDRLEDDVIRRDQSARSKVLLVRLENPADAFVIAIVDGEERKEKARIQKDTWRWHQRP